MKIFYLIIVFILSFNIASFSEEDSAQVDDAIFTVGGDESEEKTTEELENIALGESFKTQRFTSLKEATEETKPLGTPYTIEAGDELHENVFIVGGDESQAKTTDEMENIELGETYKMYEYESHEKAQKESINRPLGTPYSIQAGEELHGDVLVIGGDKSQAKTSKDTKMIEFGEPFVSYEYESFEKSEKEAKNRSLGTHYSVEAGKELHSGVYVVGGEDADEKTIVESKDIPLGLSYQSKKYSSEEDARSDSSSRGLATPYSIRTESQKEARE